MGSLFFVMIIFHHDVFRSRNITQWREAIKACHPFLYSLLLGDANSNGTGLTLLKEEDEKDRKCIFS